MDKEHKESLINTLETRPIIAEQSGNWYLCPTALLAALELIADAMEAKVHPAVAERAYERTRERRTSVAAAQIRQTFNELMEVRKKNETLLGILAEKEGDSNGTTTSD